MQRSQPLLGTFVTITAYGTDRAKLQQAVTSAFSEFRRVDQLLSIHRQDSELSRINRTAAQRPVETTPEVWALLKRCNEIAETTSGAFDVTVGPLAQLWGFIWKEYRLPEPSELSAVLPLVDYRNLQLSPPNLVKYETDGMFLDLGGVGKGYAVDCAIETLRTAGVTRAMVKAGGDLRTIGTPPGETSWTVQLEDPAKKGERSVIQLGEKALSTSGNYENFFEVNGTRYSHIIDPRTGLPVQGVASCTVTANTSTEADAFATAYFILGVEKTLLKKSRDHFVRFTIHNSTATAYETLDLK